MNQEVLATLQAARAYIVKHSRWVPAGEYLKMLIQIDQAIEKLNI